MRHAESPECANSLFEEGQHLLTPSVVSNLQKPGVQGLGLRLAALRRKKGKLMEEAAAKEEPRSEQRLLGNRYP